jgi:outer membrane lipoprotein-sorting protein
MMRTLMKLSARTLISTVLCGLAALSPLHAAPSVTEVLQDWARAERTLAFSATETVERPGAPTVRLRVQRDGRKRRLDYLAPNVRRGDSVIDDGKTTWIYLRGENVAVQTVSRPDNEMTATRATKARVAGVGSIADRLTWIVDLTRGQSQRRLWIDQKNGALLRRETRRGAQLIENSVLEDVRFGAVPASVFQWKPPAGANVSRTTGTLYASANAARRVAALRFPRWTPRGYSFESAIVDVRQGEAWLRFSGAKRFSIFQSRAQTDAALQKVDGAWFFARGGNRFVIVGLDESDARQLAASL